MSDRATELFERYLGELQAGGRPDPAAYVADAGDEADQLSGMIATYLATHPRTDIPADEVLELAARPGAGAAAAVGAAAPRASRAHRHPSRRVGAAAGRALTCRARSRKSTATSTSLRPASCRRGVARRW